MRAICLLSILLLAALTPASADARPRMTPQQLTLRGRATATQPGIRRRVRFFLPAGWTADVDPNGRQLRAFGPNGEGEILVCVALHQSQLNVALDDLHHDHKSATPSQPYEVKIPGATRASRFAIGGHERGEMLLMQKDDTWILFAAVVEAEAWPRLRRRFRAAYRSVVVEALSPAAKKPNKEPLPEAGWSR